MRVGILGGGTLGLALALRLARRGYAPTVLEAAPQLGGLATWFDYGDFTWDKYYHVICRTDAHLLGLIEELGLSERVRWAETKTGFLWSGGGSSRSSAGGHGGYRQLSMSSHWEFLTFPALSLYEKARLAAGILYCQRLPHSARLEETRAAAWLARVFGAGVYRKIWQPLLESKYGALADAMPATLMWATIRRYYSTRSKGGGRESMGFLSGGLRVLYEALEAAVTRAGGAVLCGAPATAIDDSGEAIAVQTPRGALPFDRLISTLPGALLQQLAPNVAGLSAESAVRPRFLGVVCLALVLRRSLSPYYVMNLISRGFPFTGIIEVSNLTGPQELGGRHLVMLPRYELPDSPLFEEPAEGIAERFLAGLRPVWPAIDDNLVRWYVNRERRVQAMWIDAPPPPVQKPAISADGRIWSVNAELAGRDTLNNNAIVRVADEAAAEWMEFHRPDGGERVPVSGRGAIPASALSRRERESA